MLVFWVHFVLAQAMCVHCWHTDSQTNRLIT